MISFVYYSLNSIILTLNSVSLKTHRNKSPLTEESKKQKCFVNLFSRTAFQSATDMQNPTSVMTCAYRNKEQNKDMRWIIFVLQTSRTTAAMAAILSYDEALFKNHVPFIQRTSSLIRWGWWTCFFNFRRWRHFLFKPKWDVCSRRCNKVPQ